MFDFANLFGHLECEITVVEVLTGMYDESTVLESSLSGYIGTKHWSCSTFGLCSIIGASWP